LSESLDRYFQEVDKRIQFETLGAAARNKHRQEVSKIKRLVKNLETDVAEHGDPENWKRFGDLLLASQSTARREGSVIRVADLFDENSPMVSIEVDENDSIPEAANKYFRRYTKARNAREAIELRLNDARRQMEKLEQFAVRSKMRSRRTMSNFSAIISATEGTCSEARQAGRPQTSRNKTLYVYRWIRDPRGKKASDNDFLTSRVANSRDTWMHAADYPGSHVVIRNGTKKEIPHRTLIEAAQLAAFYSQGKKQPKAAVHYT
jgi:predicted ribosome quality control (RQC) complex YloA/Tae2 family protein